jgi:uncharacterized protein YkwD
VTQAGQFNVRAAILLLVTTLALGACNTSPEGGAAVYRISAAQQGQIQERALANINSLRAASGAQPLVLNSSLNNAAAVHSRDMAQQARPWHFGSDGSSPLDRGRRAGYAAQVKGENISETYETELETIQAWMLQPDTRQVMLDPTARDLGFSFYQESTGKIWWTLVTGG